MKLNLIVNFKNCNFNNWYNKHRYQIQHSYLLQLVVCYCDSPLINIVLKKTCFSYFAIKYDKIYHLTVSGFFYFLLDVKIIELIAIQISSIINLNRVICSLLD